MKLNKGFSFIEVLVALLLVSGISIMFLTEQFKTQQILKQINLKNLAILYLNNATEQAMAKQKFTLQDKRFSLLQKNSANNIEVTISWNCKDYDVQDTCEFSRIFSTL